MEAGGREGGRRGKREGVGEQANDWFLLLVVAMVACVLPDIILGKTKGKEKEKEKKKSQQGNNKENGMEKNRNKREKTQIKSFVQHPRCLLHHFHLIGREPIILIVFVLFLALSDRKMRAGFLSLFLSLSNLGVITSFVPFFWKVVKSTTTEDKSTAKKKN